MPTCALTTLDHSSGSGGGVPGWGGAIIGVVLFLVFAGIAAYVALTYYRARVRFLDPDAAETVIGFRVTRRAPVPVHPAALPLGVARARASATCSGLSARARVKP